MNEGVRRSGNSMVFNGRHSKGAKALVGLVIACGEAYDQENEEGKENNIGDDEVDDCGEGHGYEVGGGEGEGMRSCRPSGGTIEVRTAEDWIT